MKAEMQAHAASVERRRHAGWTAAALLAIALVGFLLRVYRLGEQSVWIDEYYAYGSLNAPDLRTYLATVHFFCPDYVPLFFILQYAWAYLAGTASVPMLRLFSVLLGVSCVPLVYLLGRRVYGRRAGVIAALLLAVSPMHIWFSQSGRINVLVEFLALVSLYALVRGVHDRRWRWLSLCIGANVLMVWAYVQAGMLAGIELLYVLFFLKARFRQRALWVGVQTVLLVSPLLWLCGALPNVPEAKDDFPMTLPSFRGLLVDLVGDDAVMSSDPFVFQGATWEFLPKGLVRVLIGEHAKADLLLMLFVAACLAWLAARVFFLWPSVRRRCPDLGIRPATREELLLLAVALLPFFLLLLVSLVWRPVVMPRYTSYSSFGLYAIVGGCLAALPERWERRLAVLVLLGLYGYQLSVSLPATTRTDWLGASRTIRAEATGDDVVLVKGTYLAWEVFRFNMGECPAPIVPAYTLQVVCEKSAAFLGASSDSGARRRVWAVIEPFIYTLPPLSDFEACLDAHGLIYARTDFPGMNGVFLYRIERDAASEADDDRDIIPTGVDYAGIIEDMGLGALDPDRRAEALGLLRRFIDTEFPRTRFYYSILALELANEGHPELAMAAAEKAVALDPEYMFGRFLLAVVLGEKGDADGAKVAFEQATRTDRLGFVKLYEPLFSALYVNKDGDAAKRLVTEMDASGLFLPQAFRLRARGSTWTASTRASSRTRAGGS